MGAQGSPREGGAATSCASGEVGSEVSCDCGAAGASCGRVEVGAPAIDERALVAEAIAAREGAYVPYSHFAVGAALLDSTGTVWRGCNIENAAYTPSNCAERTAFFKAVSEGVRGFVAIAVVGGPEGAPVSEWCAPCGVCRQVMREFCDPDTFRVVLGRSADKWRTYLLRDILPMGFGPEDLGRPAPRAVGDRGSLEQGLTE